MATRTNTRRRIHFMDEVRGFDVILMIFFHAFYIIGFLFSYDIGKTLFNFFYPVQPFFAGLFIFICGISCNLSHSNVKRGLWLLVIAEFITLLLWCAKFWGIIGDDSMIWFGILHFLAVSILLFALLRPALRMIPPWLGLLLSAVFLTLCWHLPEGYFGLPSVFQWELPDVPLNTPWLYPLGLCPFSPCGDYFPLFPWFFCFLGGTYVGIWAKQGKFPRFMYKSRIPFLSAIGKNALLIYILHQPVAYGICWVVDAIIKSVS